MRKPRPKSPSTCSSEINRRDRIIDEKNSWWSNEVCRRDATIDELRREQEWMRGGWRRFVVRPPKVTQ